MYFAVITDNQICHLIFNIVFHFSINAKAAGSLLEDELDKYTSIVDNRKGLNNYWDQLSSLNVETSNNPLEWKLHLSDPNLALQHLRPLPCNESSTLPCKNEEILEKDVEKLMNWWKNGEVPSRARKVSKNEQKKVQEIIEDKDIAELFTEDDYGMCNFEKNTFQSTKKPVETVSNSRSSFFNPVRSADNQPTNSGRTFLNLGKLNAVKANSPAKNKQNISTRKNDNRQANEKCSGFLTARTELSIQQANKNNKQSGNRYQYTNNHQQPMKKTLGGKPTNPLSAPYVNPFKENQSSEEEAGPVDDRLKSIDSKMIEMIKNEIMDCGTPITWNDIAGLECAKRIIQEIVVFPMLRPDIFTGLRRPPKGILLFGPPGTGKTLIGKCIASQSKSTFFSISASSLTSKWIGEGEKMVRALFAVAQVEQPSVIFIDEIDSLLCQRSESEHEASRRMKTEFLVQLDGAATGDEDRILVIGATNRPQELDEAARRRLVKRLYVPLPELEARKQIVRNLLKSERHDLTEQHVHQIAEMSDGYSGADMTNLCKEASMGPIRSIPFDQLEYISTDNVRKVTFQDFKDALDTVRPSVSNKDLSIYLDWDRTYGTASTQARV